MPLLAWPAGCPVAAASFLPSEVGAETGEESRTVASSATHA